MQTADYGAGKRDVEDRTSKRFPQGKKKEKWTTSGETKRLGGGGYKKGHG